jgi:hypothetical protein
MLADGAIPGTILSGALKTLDSAASAKLSPPSNVACSFGAYNEASASVREVAPCISLLSFARTMMDTFVSIFDIKYYKVHIGTL